MEKCKNVLKEKLLTEKQKHKIHSKNNITCLFIYHIAKCVEKLITTKTLNNNYSLGPVL